jgi:hypothetical protein
MLKMQSNDTTALLILLDCSSFGPFYACIKNQDFYGTPSALNLASRALFQNKSFPFKHWTVLEWLIIPVKDY